MKNLKNEKVDESRIWAQLITKANKEQTLCDVINKSKFESFRGTLPRLVDLELSKRILNANQMRSFSLLNPEE